MDNTKQPFGRELSSQEITFVSGGDGPIVDIATNTASAVDALQEPYDALIESIVDAMCEFTGNC